MPRPQRTQRPGPSPLQQVHLTRPLSHNPGHGLVRDPAFWKRFSTAVHSREDVNLESGLKSAASSVDMKYGDEWLIQQHRDKRNCRILCVSITFAVALVIAAAIFVAYYFLKIR